MRKARTALLALALLTALCLPARADLTLALPTAATPFAAAVEAALAATPRPVAPATPDAASNGKPQDPNDDPVAVQLQAQLALLIPAAAAASGGVVPANPGVLPAPAPPFKP